ncbi:hypothetical protein AYO44_03565 [Planctomycetaceae bacterium SCGC AG-212-F19]|nr:hypothetical protein AYO44_03565 [Planctomycetaceae bacterium SCGC AG-212-F19]
MTRRFLVGGILVLALQVAAYGDDKNGGKLPPAPTNPNLEKMKKLAGTWVAADKDGKPTDQVVSVIKLTAGGSAVHETLFPGQPMEMVSVYTAEGPDLVMTHYCVLGNQPRMKSDPKSLPNQISFKFAGGTNLDPKKDKHMHEATLTFIDNDHIEIAGITWEGGAPAKDMCGVMKLIRKK